MSSYKFIGCAHPIAFNHDFCMMCVAVQFNYEELLNNPVSDENLAGVLEANKAAVPAAILEPKKESKDSVQFAGERMVTEEERKQHQALKSQD